MATTAITITINIDNSILNDAVRCFLLKNPMPTHPDGQIPPNQIPDYATNLEWFQAWVKQKLRDELIAGRLMEIEQQRVAAVEILIDEFRNLVT